jgi:hypothetical protein
VNPDRTYPQSPVFESIMEIITFIYNSDRKGSAVDSVLDSLQEWEESSEYINTGTGGSEREAMLLVGESTRIGSNPEETFDEAGNPDFSMGVLITEQETGRRDLHISEEMLDAL